MIETALPLDKRRLQCYLAFVLADMLALFAGFWSAGYLYLGNLGLSQSGLLAQLVVPIFLTVGLYNGAYSMAALADAVHGALRALLALAISAAAVVFIAFYTKASEEFSRLSFTSGVLLAAFCMIWTRTQMRAFGSTQIWRNVGAQTKGFKGHVTNALDGPFVALLHEDRADESGDRGFIREDADDCGAPLDLAVQALDGVGALELDTILPWEGHIDEHIGFRVVHHRGQFGEFGPHLVSDCPLLLAGRFRRLLGEGCANKG